MAKRAHGEGTVYKDSQRGGWVAQASAGTDPLSGKRRRVKVRAKTKGEALRRLSDRMSKLDHGRFGSLLDAWIARGMPGQKPKSGRTKKTLNHLIGTHIVPTFDNFATSAITVELVEEFLEGKADDGLSRATLVKLRGILSQVFAYAVARKHVDWNPASLAVLPHTKPPKEGRALTQSELDSLLAVCENLDPDCDGERLGAWVHVTATLGLRPGEANALEWDRVDFDAGTIVIARSLDPGPPPTLKSTKTKETRTLEAPERTLGVLRDHRKRQAEERLMMGDRWPMKWGKLVFVSEAGTPLQAGSLRKWIQRVADTAGIEGSVTPYDMRHTAASLLAARGVPPLLLAQLLGHKDARVLSRYYMHDVTPTISTAVTGWE
ncbi:MAG: DUF3435 domain-containing protein [Acidimicrobiia bacterium]|nr:DUF3435 domain-containing protein [Acidimicrobiia bacterium]